MDPPLHLHGTGAMIETQELEPLCKSFIFKSYVSQAVQELRSCAKDAKTLLSQREMPQRGWSEVMLIKGYRGELSTGGHCPRSRLERAR